MESRKANDFFERVFDDMVARHPMFQAELGIKDDYDKWDDISAENQEREIEITQKELETLRQTIDYAKLDEQTRISYDLFVLQAKEKITNFRFRFHDYPVNQMFGLQSEIPAFLINLHRITSESDARAYVSRLDKVDELIEQLIENLKLRAEKGTIPPTFVFAHTIRDCENIKNGSTLIDDFKNKVAGLVLAQTRKNELIAEAGAALAASVKPAYETLINYLRELEKKSSNDDGVWKLPDGLAYYDTRLKRITTTNLTAEEIHQTGLREVARIHDEMRGIMKAVEFEGSLQEFFDFMRTDQRFYYSNDQPGRERYLKKATELIETMKGRLDELFLTRPKSDLVVKRVEPFRERSAGKAFYQSPAIDGSRPGTYYANLFDMNSMPTYQMEALAYHEGIPGHHMQIAIAQELEGLPKFRKYGRFTAYVEGWGLYSEYIPKEMGFYPDPYSDFGRLAMELWRACRLVVDTGIHYKRWTREEGIDYYLTNTPNPKGDCIKMVERHIVMPGQATAYKIGMLKILELREKAKSELSDAFDNREFHDVVLTSGPVPLNVLEKMVDGYIAGKVGS
jgi:uncharacterized protein (DUF885 family)